MASDVLSILVGETWRKAGMVAKASGNAITSGTVNYYLKAKSGDNAGKWWKNSDQTWAAVETANAMTHDADGNWTIELAESPFADGVVYLEYAKESTDLHVAGEGRLLRGKAVDYGLASADAGATAVSRLTAAQAADAVWDEAKSEHTTAGTFGLWLGTKLWNWLGALMGKTADATTRAEINATTAGAGYNETTDSQEAIADAQLTAAQAFAAVLTTQMTEAYAADGTAPTLAQAIFLIQQSLHEFSISGTTRTVKKLDGLTTAATFTLDDADAPTSTTRAS